MLEAVRELAPRIRAAAPTIEAQRRLPDELFGALSDLGVFKAHLPPRLGGCGATLTHMAPVIEEIARADGSAGWLAYVGSEALRQTLLLPEPVAKAITRERRAFIAGMFTPGQSRAVAVDGGYRVTGRWHTCSGSLHADWIIGGAAVYDGEQPRLNPDGTPVRRLNFIPAQAATVLDTWYVGGLKGTNSNDITADDVFVPEEFGVYTVEPPDVGLHMMVPLGIARAAMDEFIQLAHVKGPSKAGGTLYREMPSVQHQVGAIEAALRAARWYVMASLAEVDARVAKGEPTTPTPVQREAFLMAAAHAAQVALDVVDTLHRIGGTAGIFESSHLLRCFLDVHVACAHVSLQPINLEIAGKRLLS